MSHERRSKREILDYRRVHKDLLPKSQGRSVRKSSMDDIYQTYSGYLKQFPLWPRLQTFHHYAEPTIALGGRIQLRWRREALGFVKPKQSPSRPKSSAPAVKGAFPEVELVERMRWQLVASIRAHLLSWQCIAPELSGVLAGRLARALLYLKSDDSVEELVIKEAKRLIPEDAPNYTYSMQILRLFAAEDLPRLRNNAWLRLAEWKGVEAQPKEPQPEEQAEAKKLAHTLKRESLHFRRFFSQLFTSHAEILAAVARVRHH